MSGSTRVFNVIAASAGALLLLAALTATGLVAVEGTGSLVGLIALAGAQIWVLICALHQRSLIQASNGQSESDLIECESEGESSTAPFVDLGDNIELFGEEIELFGEESAPAEVSSSASAPRATAPQAAPQPAGDAHDMLLGFAEQLETVVEALVQQVDFSAEQVEDAAIHTTEFTEGSCARVARAEGAAAQATTRMQQVVASVQAVTQAITNINAQMSNSERIIQEAVSRVQKTDGIAQVLQGAAHRIGAVVSMIQKVARQTNFLALNATIEAQRAGAAGEGFTVVADEVKRLARQTAEAAGEVSDQISEVQTATKDVVGAIMEISDVITNIEAVVSSIKSDVDHQASSTLEINQHIEETLASNQHIQDEVGGIQGALDGILEKASESLCTTSVLKTSSQQLSVEVKQFLCYLKGSHGPSEAAGGDEVWGDGNTEPTQAIT